MSKSKNLTNKLQSYGCFKMAKDVHFRVNITVYGDEIINVDTASFKMVNITFTKTTNVLLAICLLSLGVARGTRI